MTLLFIAAALFAASLDAQETTTTTVTTISETQVNRAPVVEDSILVQTPAGAVRRVALGTGVALDKSGVVWRLIVTVPAPSPNVVKDAEPLTRNADGTWQLARDTVGGVKIWRNGVLMLAGAGRDYTRNGRVITFTALQGSLPDDVVAAEY